MLPPRGRLRPQACAPSAPRFPGYLQVLQHLEHEPRRPVGHAAAQGRGHRCGFQDLLATHPQVNRPADVVLDSAVTGVADADAQGDELLVPAFQGAVGQRLFLQRSQFAKGADSNRKALLCQNTEEKLTK